jgi:hypothetical protein
MPLCINDPKKSYKGNEPSPKGLGYCGHCEKVGIIKKGLDGNLWIIINTKKNSKKWILHKRILTKNNIYYKKIKDKYTGYKTYFTQFNSSLPYLVYIKNKDVIIYNIPENTEIDKSSYDRNDIKWMYINLVKKYKANEVFIGKSPLIEMTNYSNGYGSKFDGNTILLSLNNNNYIYIGKNIEKCKINDKIQKYYSFVGNNDVPYPVAIGKKNIYFFDYPEGYLPIKEFPKIKSNKDLQSIIDKGTELSPFLIPFYGNLKKKYLISLEEFKKIKNKSLDEITLDEMKNLAKMFQVTTSGTKKELADRLEKVGRIIVYKK